MVSVFDEPVQATYTENETYLQVVLFTMTVAIKNNNKTPLVVPPVVRRKAGFKSGAEIEFRAVGGVITILPKLPADDEEYTPAERRAIDRGIAQSEKEYQQGKNAGPFDTAEAFLADLHRESDKLDARKRNRTGK